MGHADPLKAQPQPCVDFRCTDIIRPIVGFGLCTRNECQIKLRVEIRELVDSGTIADAFLPHHVLSDDITIN